MTDDEIDDMLHDLIDWAVLTDDQRKAARAWLSKARICYLAMSQLAAESGSSVEVLIAAPESQNG
jgi:ribonucleotide reductase beta subunit family protein with ferritin-like domain